MRASKIPSHRLPERVAGIGPTAKRLKTDHYSVLKLALLGVLDAEVVDGLPKISIASIERYERELAERTTA
jgi:hypothetical protein